MPSSCCEMRLRKDRVYYFPASLSTPRKWHCAPPLSPSPKGNPCARLALGLAAPLRSAVGAGARGGGPAREPGGPALASPGPRARRGRRHPVGRLVHTRSLYGTFYFRFTFV